MVSWITAGRRQSHKTLEWSRWAVARQEVSMKSRLVGSSLAVLAVAFLVGCGGDSSLTTSASLDAAPGSGAGGVRLTGRVLGVSATSSTSASVRTVRGPEPVVVTVRENPRITTAVGADGTFTLRGLPTGAFTLDFTRGNVKLGSLRIRSVLPNQQITITVDISSGSAELVSERRTGIGHGDIEIEGPVERVARLDPGGDSRFVIDGYTVVARPGVTAIREGGTARTVADVTKGRQVHVKGVWENDNGLQVVVAHEIILQGPAPTGTPRACMINGGTVGSGIQLEGTVATGGAGGFSMNVNRATAPVDVSTSGAEFVCSPRSGPHAPSPQECKAKVAPGAQVHVAGTLTSCDASSALVTASQVKPQK
jgi:hypothetical protein